jgi:pimeloyl-ACP methyl ester carboxylesterase
MLKKVKMKSLYALLLIAGFAFASCNGPLNENLLQCNCTDIGIDSAWADSSAVTCYKIYVNQTFDNPENGKIQLAAIHAKRTGEEDAGPLLYLHGGPGLSTLTNAKKYLGSKDWKAIRERHDVVMFDYRGTGFSEPSLCEDIIDSLKSFRMTNPSPGDFRKKKLELYLQCREMLPGRSIDLASFRSVQIAADADAVRDALKIKQWNVYGVSYGTMVGLHYIRSFPAHLRSVVLDSPFPPNAPSFDFIHTMNESLVHMQERLLADSLTAKKFPDIIGDFSKVSMRLNEVPVKISGVDFTGDDFAWAMVMSFYNTKVVHLIPLALQEFAKGNDELLSNWVLNLSSLEQHGRVNEFQAAFIDCYECKPVKAEDSPDSLAARYPYLAALSRKEYIELCYQFRPEKPEAKSFEAVKSDLPVLVIGGEFDPGTPPSFGRAASQSLTNAANIIVPNASHAATHYNDCTLSIVKSFLQHPSVKPDTTCISRIETIQFATHDVDVELQEIIKK